jgi:plastocyanin
MHETEERHERLRTIFVNFAVFVAFVVSAATASAATGTIKGHVTLMGAPPANPVIRMGADPVCASLARATGKLPTQQLVVTDGKGGLANTFVALQGNFPATPVSKEPVTVNQRTCQYLPRVVGARVGQVLKIVNQDTTVHNLHSLSAKNVFNVTQPKSGMVYNFALKAAEVMLRVKCDIHSWMLGYVGVVNHPYFAVSGADGSFTIANVPAGRYTIKTWHERFGELTRTVTVTAGQVTNLDIPYSSTAKPKFAARIQDLNVPAG